MRALKLIQLMKTNSASMSDELVRKIRASGKCEQLLLKVPESEQRQYASQIYQALMEWLADETDSVLEHHYVALGNTIRTIRKQYWPFALLSRQIRWFFLGV